MLQISVPTLLLDKGKAKRNINQMKIRAEKAGVSLRPHFKTHQSVEIGEWFKELDISKIAVSSLRMAEKFAAGGWRDILIAIPVNVLEIDRINLLSEKVKLGLCIDCEVPVAMLKRELKNEVDIYIEIDTGYHRTGIEWNKIETIDRSLERIKTSELMSFRGFMIHAGNTYKVEGNSKEIKRDKILDIHRNSIERLSSLVTHYSDSYPEIEISYGDTPSCSIAEDFGVVTEIRPGNFVFYDLTMSELGVCEENDIAVAMACPAIGVNHQRHEVAIYGGGIHFSKDKLSIGGVDVYGKLVQSYNRGWGDVIPGAIVKSLSQEHGIISIQNKVAINRIGVGDVLSFLPVHSCLTAACMGGYLTTEGEMISI